jgi:23S rRNA pseudouridine2605 synthase
MLGRKSSGRFTGSRRSHPLPEPSVCAGGRRTEKGSFLIAEQLQAARSAHWRQKQNPILTLDDAQGWLGQHPLCLYLPRQAQLPAPAPSFVEACMGSRSATPGPAAIEQAQGLLTRLIASGNVVALNLLGAVGERPDFLAHSDALPYVLSLRGDKDWKHAPQKSSGHKVSPLVLELWKVLESSGVLTAAAARETLGRELTEAAVLRALCELWQGMRINPLYAEEGQATSWEMLRVRHLEALGAGGATSQVTAISLLVSMYLQSVYAATSEEIEIFLSPVASRSRVREAVRGLSATRQIHSLSMDAQTYHFLEGGLPEFAEAILPAATTEPIRKAPMPDPVAAPIVRRRPTSPPPDVSQAAPPLPRQAPRPRPESPPPAAKGGWKSPGRAAPPARSPWRPAGKPPASGPPPRWAGKDRGAVAGGKVRPAPGARPDPRRDTRPKTRDAARPNARGEAPPFNKPAPWSRPTPAPGSTPRPVSAAGRGDAPFRPPQKTGDRFRPNRGPNPRPNARPASRPAGGGRPADAGATRSYRAPGRPPASGRPATPFKPRENRPARPAGARGFSAPGRPVRTAPGGGRPPGRSGPPSATGGASRGANYNRPRPGGYARPGAKSTSDSREKAGRPPFSRDSRPAKTGAKPPARPWSKTGKPPFKSGKPGKPSYRGDKPARKKPGA